MHGVEIHILILIARPSFFPPLLNRSTSFLLPSAHCPFGGYTPRKKVQVQKHHSKGQCLHLTNHHWHSKSLPNISSYERLQFFTLSSLPPAASGSTNGGNLPRRALGPHHYIPNKKQSKASFFKIAGKVTLFLDGLPRVRYVFLC